MRNNIIYAIFSIIILITACSAEFSDGVAEINLSNDKIEDYTPTLEHPGILHTAHSIDRMRAIVSSADVNNPAYQTYLDMVKDARSKSDYAIRGPFKIIARDGEYSYTKNSFEMDFAAAHMNALMWCITQEEAHAKKALDILLAYADELELIASSNDAPLLAGFESFRIAFTAEILIHTYHKMKEDDIVKINNMLRSVFLPVINKFYNTPPYTNGNWGLIITRAHLAMAILWNDVDMYKTGINFLLQGHDNGTLTNYIDGDTGQCQESGRDQAHTQLGMGVLASICEIAYKQGNDLYGALDNRLLRGYEYTAKYNLGYDVPFKTWIDITGKYSNWKTISESYRGNFRSIYAIAYNHYVIRKGLSMPYTSDILEKHPKGKYDGDGIDYDVFQFCDGKSN